MVAVECGICHKVFTRTEHLMRHERSHTGARPYQCALCSRSFPRQDSLVRHEKLHSRRRDSNAASSWRVSNDWTIRSDFAHTSGPVVPQTPDLAPGTSEAPSFSPVVPEGPILPSPVVREGPQLQPAPVAPEGSHHTPPMVPEGPYRTPGAPERTSLPSVVTEGPRLPSVSRSMGQTGSMDLDFELIWPDSEDLWQTLMSTDANNPWQKSLDTPCSSYMTLDTPRSFEERSLPRGAPPSGVNHQAVQDVSKMVSSVAVAAAATLNAITSVFLDECLHMFFVKFIPTFPVLHRATFVFRDCTQPLLLNAIAIGSLYLGPKDALEKGEALWHLAQTAVATSWQTLITHRGPYDACDGVQLVLTGVLSQLYGVLSRNRDIRSTSQAFHSLAFYWARRCGMLDNDPYPARSVPPADAPDSAKDYQWRLWAAREIQQRSLLALYMLDGLISHMSGDPTSVRHTTNQVHVPSNEAAFEASTANEWISQMRSAATSQSTSFRTILRRLFNPGAEAAWLDTTLSAFSYKVILEGLQSLLSDAESDGGAAVGVPTRSDVRRALNQIYESIRLNASLSSADRLETLLRWHAICLDTSVDSSLLCRNLCAKYDIRQHIWRDAHGLQANMDLATWPTTHAARRALLHAMAIQEIIEQLPRGRAHAIHMPSSLFAAATVYSVFALGSESAVKIPSTVTWQDAFLDDRPPTEVYSPVYRLPAMQVAESDTARYIRGDRLQGTDVTSRNLLYELSSMQKLFGCLTAQWGLAFDMEAVVEKWIELCR
ncbi:hypothetical protein G647_02430 [Cladophialophora carrionii CBS 160.54]|uniref:C2H2-type domain-containing protein n=1 Tax=Cladophialophora carrionii CBS 160.54 TaxID=1279043 RepID=V9DG50_9EURO|nr:uncharacterized protein G647_02430 [Cladophialophora carrionii CBS 160.54]ETI25656.1 hypothetical protein G647_02430 [Cladophialophora carrionii CBS 160.54]